MKCPFFQSTDISVKDSRDTNEGKAIRQRIANLIIRKHAKPLAADNKKKYVRYEHVDIVSIENTDVKTIGVEYLAYEAAKKISLPEILLKCGFSRKKSAVLQLPILVICIKIDYTKFLIYYLKTKAQ